MTDEAATVFDAVGGQRFFDDLVERFYGRVEHDAVLRPLYPEDLGPGKRGLALFLGQYWGGPPAYSAEKGHPRLRMRHGPFVIGRRERDAWFDAMVASVRETGVDPAVEQRLLDYFTMAADHLVNDPSG